YQSCASVRTLLPPGRNIQPGCPDPILTSKHNTMRSIKYILLLSIVVFQSCQDNVLERSPLDKVAENDVWNDPVMMSAYVTNLYSRMPFGAFENYNWYCWTDEGTTSTGNGGSMTQGTVSKT